VPEKGKEAKEYLKKELNEILVEALAACAKSKPENPTLFVSEYLRDHH
jgi:hypothetical protein